MWLGDLDVLRKNLFSYYSFINENTMKSNYTGETLMSYEVADMIEDCFENAPIIDPETLPVVKELREQLAGITAERDAAVEALAKARSCEACAHAGEVSSGACETADYECAACAAVCVCKDCREGSLWKWKGGSGHEIP